MSACIPCEQLSTWPTRPHLDCRPTARPHPPYYTPKLFSTVLHESQEWSQTGLPWRNSVWRRKTFTPVCILSRTNVENMAFLVRNSDKRVSPVFRVSDSGAFVKAPHFIDRVAIALHWKVECDATHIYSKLVNGRHLSSILTKLSIHALHTG